MLDDTKAIAAKDIVNQADAVYALNRAYIIITDSSMTYTFSNMIDALNILYDAGWEVDGMTTVEFAMQVIMRNSKYKRKNSG
jgi:hypothetical protein